MPLFFTSRVIPAVSYQRYNGEAATPKEREARSGDFHPLLFCRRGLWAPSLSGGAISHPDPPSVIALEPQQRYRGSLSNPTAKTATSGYHLGAALGSLSIALSLGGCHLLSRSLSVPPALFLRWLARRRRLAARHASGSRQASDGSHLHH